MENLLITLLSDQTIPNVQFIKEKRTVNTVFLFVTTDAMERKSIGQWIQSVCNISTEKIVTKVVNPFSLADIENKLNELSYDEYDEIFVNVTGGTKIMSMGVNDFFKQKNANIYYVSNGQTYLQIFPQRKEHQFSKQLTVNEYFNSYGISICAPKIVVSKEYTLKFLDKYHFDEKEMLIIKKLNDARNYRDEFKKYKKKDIPIPINEFEDGMCFLKKIQFPLSDVNKTTINRDEIKYLTGEWYEQWCYFKIKEKYHIADDYITTGIKIKNANNIENELDVVYMYQGNLHIIECKTSVTTLDKTNILTDTIYKQAAIKKYFGLFVKPRIFTLSSKEDNEIRNAHLDRAKDFDIELKCKEDLLEFLKNE